MGWRGKDNNNEVLLHYLIDKYLNGATTDSIEIYEKSIDIKIENWRKSGYVRLWFHPEINIEEIEDKELRALAAINYITVLISTSSARKRNTYYSYIANPEIRQSIASIVEYK